MVQVEDESLDFSNAQATAYHYWGKEENQSVFLLLWVDLVIDSIQILVFGLPFMIYAPIYWVGQ